MKKLLAQTATMKILFLITITASLLSGCVTSKNSLSYRIDGKRTANQIARDEGYAIGYDKGRLHEIDRKQKP